MDLSTIYLGLRLPHPFVVGASPIADTLDSAKSAEDAGAAAIVMRSLFEEQLVAEALASHEAYAPHEHAFAEALSYSPEPEEFVFGPDEYLERLRRLKEGLSIPVIASLNGSSPGGWLEFARAMETAGADALELNLYEVVTDPAESSAAVEERLVGVVREVSQALRIPLAVKLSPFFTSLTHLATRLEQAGARGLVVFNRFYEPDIEIDELEVRMRASYSSSAELLLRLRWLGILSGTLESASLAVSGGVHTASDAVKAIMAGADAVQTVSAVLSNGPEHLAHLRQAVERWMEEKEYESIDQMRGSMNVLRCPDPTAYTRGNYMRTLLTRPIA